MSSDDMARDDYTSEASSSGESMAIGRTAADDERDFVRRCEHVKRQVAVRMYREHLQSLGRSRRPVSGSSGRFLHEHGDDEYPRIRERLGQELPANTCRNIDMLVNYLERMWAVPLRPNDSEFLRQLGQASDPNKTTLLQQFQVLSRTASMERRIAESHTRMLAEVISREVQHTLYQPATEFLVRTLPEEYRRQMLEWISDLRFSLGCNIQCRHNELAFRDDWRARFANARLLVRVCVGKTGRRWRIKQSQSRLRKRKCGKRGHLAVSTQLQSMLSLTLALFSTSGTGTPATGYEAQRVQRPGTRSCPKSGVRAGRSENKGKLQTLLHFLVMTSNFSGSNGVKVGPSPMGGPGAPILGAKPHGNVAASSAEAARKRSFRRAVQRNTNSCDQATWYRGRYLTLKQLGATSSARKVGNDGHHNKSINAKSQFPRLRIITWNCGGLRDTRCREITQWLCDEHDAGRPVHVMVIQETAWKHDVEYKTSTAKPHGPQWYVLHSGSGAAEGGIMVFILSTLVNTEQIRSAPIHPGRLFHVRLMLDPPLDILGVYQHAWNVQKKPLQADPVEINGFSKVQQLLQRRRKVWKELGTWIAGIPRRNGCIILGDLNTPAQPIPSLIGEGIDKPGASIVQTDYDHVQQLIRAHACSLLNTWSKAGPSARTFLPAMHSGPNHGTQIDFVMTRGKSADGVAKQAKPIEAPFVPHTGCRHLPVECFGMCACSRVFGCS